MKIHLGQINPTIGAFSHNLGLIYSEVLSAKQNGADVVVLPELCVCGYYPDDLLNDPFFLEEIHSANQQLIETSLEFPEILIIAGTVLPSEREGGKPHNAALALLNGKIIFKHLKMLLPTYGIFDERRHFDPSPELKPETFEYQGSCCAILICEDIWASEEPSYGLDPVDQLGKVDFLFTINASPSHLGKFEQRSRVLSHVAKQIGGTLVYVNQEGGQDEIVYDGGSCIVSGTGNLIAALPRFTMMKNAGRTIIPDLAYGYEEENLDKWAFYRKQIKVGLRDYMSRCGFERVLVGSSGGIDSALTLALAVDALGPDKVIAVSMPSEFSSQGSVTHSEMLCHRLGIQQHTHSIKNLVEIEQQNFPQAFGTPLSGLALENVQARFRGLILMSLSNSNGALLLTTGNKSETAVGYCTLYGDTNGGLNLIGDLFKTEVFDLARYLNRVGIGDGIRDVIPEEIINKAPSAELSPGQTDQDSLPPYPVLDEILMAFIEHDKGAIERLERHPVELIARVRKLVACSEYKRRQAAPIIRLRPRAFGRGRRVPIATNWA